MRMKKILTLQNDGSEASPLLKDYSDSDDDWRGTGVNVVRRVYQQETLNQDAGYSQPHRTLRRQCYKWLRRCGVFDCLGSSLQIARWLPRYDPRKYLLGDVVAGATAAVMHIPQGMAYALLAEVHAVTGLYMAFFPALVYVVFGTCPHISIGTFAVACLMTGKVVLQHARNVTDIAEPSSEPQYLSDGGGYSPVEVVSTLCMTVGLLQLLMWVLRMGAVSTLLSEPLVSGFTSGSAYQVVFSQLKDMLGVSVPKRIGNFKVVYTVLDIINNISTFNLVTFLIALTTTIIVGLNNELLKPWVSKRSKLPVPIELMVVVLGTAVSHIFSFNSVYKVKVIGFVPTGLPAAEIPDFTLVPMIVMDAFSIALVTYSVTMSMALTFAAKEKYEIDSNQELLAIGASNAVGSLFGCAPVCASLSRSAIQYQSGCKTQLTTVVSAAVILCVLLWVGPCFEPLPRAVLGAVIAVSLRNMLCQVRDFLKFWRLSKLDAVTWLLTFLSTVFINIDIGLCVGLVASVCALFFRSQTPYTCLLGRVGDTDLYLDCKRYRAVKEIPGVKIFHYCGGLNFATKNLFRSTLYRKIGYLRSAEAPALPMAEPEDKEPEQNLEFDESVFSRVKCVIIDATALCYVDAPGVRALVGVQQALSAYKINVLLAGANAPVLEMVNKFNSLEEEKLDVALYPTVHDAVTWYYKLLKSQTSLVRPREGAE